MVAEEQGQAVEHLRWRGQGPGLHVLVEVLVSVLIEWAEECWT